MAVLFYAENVSLKLTGLTGRLLHLPSAIYSVWAGFIDQDLASPARFL